MIVSSLVVVALVTSPPASVGVGLDLAWESPPGCPDEAEVRQAIDAYLGREQFGPGVEEVRVRGSIAADGGEFRLTVDVALPDGARVERSVAAKRCSELGGAAGLVIAVALDPLRVGEVAPPPAVVEPTDEPEPVREPAPEKKARTLHAEIHVGGGGEIGTLPVIGGGVWAAVGLSGPRFRVEVDGQWWGPREIRPFGAAPDAGASVQLGSAALRGCFVPRVGVVELPSCLAFEAGLARARGIGLDVAKVSHQPWVAVALGQELVWISRRRVGVWIAADALLNVVRAEFQVDDLGSVVELGWVGFRFLGGLAVRI
jgi:hypothetical protein